MGVRWFGGFFFKNQYIAFVQSQSPYILMFSWNPGFGTKFTDPTNLPAGSSFGVTFRPTSDDIVVGHLNFPRVTAYSFTVSGFGTKYANPSSSTGGTAALKLSFSPNGNDIVIPNNSTGVYDVYKWSSGFDTKYATPTYTDTSPSNSDKAVFSPNNDALFISLGDGSRGVLAYKWSSSGFGTKYAAPSTGSTGGANSVAISPDGAYICLGKSSGGTPFLAAYPWSYSGGFGTQLSEPATSVGSNYDVTFSPDSNVVAFATGNELTVYKWSSSGFGTKYAAAAGAQNNVGNGVAFNAGGTNIAVAHTNSPIVSTYDWSESSGFGSRYSNYSNPVQADGRAVAFK